MKFLRELPPMTQASGTANMVQNRLSIRVHDGQVVGPDGAALNAAGSVVTIPDIRMKPAQLQLDLEGYGPLGTALALLDRPPFRILSRVGRTPDIADGMATARARVTLPLKRNIQNADVDYDVCLLYTSPSPRDS